MKLQPTSTFKVSPNIVFRKQNDSYLLLEIEGNNIFEFDKVSAHVFSEIVDGQSVEEIIQSVPESFEDLSENSNSEVFEFIESLVQAKIIEVC